MRYLLDAKALIALTVEDHEHHALVSDWVQRAREFALCPIVEGALVRFHVRVGNSATLALEVLAALYASSAVKVEFCPASLSYCSANLTRVLGHRQVTDAYLVNLAVSKGAKLVTLDRPLGTIFPEQTLLLA